MRSSLWRMAVYAALVSVAIVSGSAVQAKPPAEAKEPAAEEPAAEKPADELPPALTHYKGREIAQTMHYLGAPWLTRESRDREEDCNTLLKVLDLKPGQA